MRNDGDGIAGRRVLVTGAARGIGALLARRLHQRGARVALLGLEPELLRAGRRLRRRAVVRVRRDRPRRGRRRRGGRGRGARRARRRRGQRGDRPPAAADRRRPARSWSGRWPSTWSAPTTLVRAAGPHVAHPRLRPADRIAGRGGAPAAAGAYCASKAAVEALGDTLRDRAAPPGAEVGVAYFAELDTDMTSRGFGTEAAAELSPLGGHGRRRAGRARDRRAGARDRRAVAAGRLAALGRSAAADQDGGPAPRRAPVRRPPACEALELARAERAPLTTEQPSAEPRP